MTVEEAMRRVRRTTKCFVVWRADTGEIVSVEDADPGGKPAVESFGELLGGMGGKGPFPTRGRFLVSEAVTPALLEHETEECRRTNRRVAILNEWALSPAARLVEILETRDYEAPYVGPHDADYVLRLLSHLHADELAGPRRDLRQRLHKLWVGPGLDGGTRLQLAQHLTVLDGDADALKALYTARPEGWDIYHFTDAFGDVRTKDPEIIRRLVEVVEQPGMFGPRFEAMVALGKIGPPAGPRAVEAMRAHIYDSSEWVHDVRERVIQRITSPPEQWEKCPRCHRGRVLATGPDGNWVRACPDCFELGFVPVVRT